MRTSDAVDFEPHRAYLVGLAYRMLGSVAEAEDVVQDAWLRWQAVDADVAHPPRTKRTWSLKGRRDGSTIT